MGDDQERVSELNDDERNGDGGVQHEHPAVEVVADNDTKHVAEEVVNELHTAFSWQGRLPIPPDFREYNEIVPGLARELADELLAEGKRIDRAQALDEQVSNRVLTIMEENAASDRAFRSHAFNWLLPVFYLPWLVVTLVLLLDIQDGAKVLIVIAILAAAVGPLVIALLKGRLSKTEAEAMESIIPKVVAAVRDVAREGQETTKTDRNDADTRRRSIDSSASGNDDFQ